MILLSGNVHFAEISWTDEGPYPLYDFTSSGLTHVYEEYPKAKPLHSRSVTSMAVEWSSIGNAVLS